MKKIFLALTLAVFTLFSENLQAQEAEEGGSRISWDKVLKDWNASIHLGTTIPYTDVRTYDWAPVFKPTSEMQYAVGASITKMMGNVFGIQARYTYGRVRGVAKDDSEFFEDNLQAPAYGFDLPFFFSTQFHQPSVSLYINFSNMFVGTNRVIRAKRDGKDLKERRVSVYGRVGIGMNFFDSKLYDGTDPKFKDKENSLVTGGNRLFLRGYSNKVSEIVFPTALGLKIKATKKIDVSLEAEMNFVHDDKFDAMVVNGFHRQGANDGNNFGEYTNGSIGGRYDKYLVVSAGVHYKFGTLKSQDEHLEWINPLEAYMDVTDEKIDYLMDNMYRVKDGDDDGVIDELDLEPDTEEGAFVDTHGRTLDSDGDGYPDHEDPEPFSTSALPIEKGVNVYPKPALSPEMVTKIEQMIEQEEKGLDVKNSVGWALTMIHFDLDKSDIRPDMVPELFKVATIMNKYPDLNVNVIGHTDIRDTEDYNNSLSNRRTEAAINYIVENYGVDRGRFVPSFKGENDNLIKGAKTEKEHYINRRVEFVPANY